MLVSVLQCSGCHIVVVPITEKALTLSDDLTYAMQKEQTNQQRSLSQQNVTEMNHYCLNKKIIEKKNLKKKKTALKKKKKKI